MNVYPVPGRRIHDPETKRLLTAEGITVNEHSIFWARRVRDGDVTTTAPEAVPAAAGETAETKGAAPAVVQPADHRMEDEES
jgi:hypothetical protein